MNAKELLNNYNYKTATITLSRPFKNGEPKVFEIQSLSQGDFISIMGVPFIMKFLNNENVTLTDDLIEKQIDIIKKVVCAGVISVKLVTKAQTECKDDEVSVNIIDIEDLYELYNAIMEHSLGGVEKVEFFPEEPKC